MHPGGEVAAAASAEEAGLAYTLSTISGHKLENVRAASNAPVWYQLYLVGGREVAEGAILVLPPLEKPELPARSRFCVMMWNVRCASLAVRPSQR